MRESRAGWDLIFPAGFGAAGVVFQDGSDPRKENVEPGLVCAGSGLALCSLNPQQERGRSLLPGTFHSL